MEHRLVLSDDRLHVDGAVVEVFQSGVHDFVDVLTDEHDLLRITVLLVDLQSRDDEAYFVDVLEDVWLEMPIVQDESKMVLYFDLVSYFASFTLSLAHDGDQHVCQVEKHGKGADHIKEIQTRRLRTFSKLKVRVVCCSKYKIMHVPNSLRVCPIVNSINLILFEIIKHDLVLGENVKRAGKHESENN